MSRIDSLIEVAASVGDGVAVDWSGITPPSEEARRVLRQLRILEQIGAVTGTTPREPTVGAPDPAGADGGEHESGRRPWGPLVIVELIGSGSHADVYLARDPRLDRRVALKLLKHQRRRGDTADQDEEAIHEARLLARVHHPHVMTVHGAERINGRVGIWTEFVDGRTLADELRERGPLPVSEVVAVGLAVSSALDAVHAAGVLHRDIKAQNVLRGRDGRVVLADFGTSREVSGGDADLAGTPLYLAPEVFAGDPASARSDIYSVGVLLYLLATATFPFEGRSVEELRAALAGGSRVALLRRAPAVPRRIAEVIERAAHPDPARRFESATALARALRAASQPTRLAPAAPLAGLALVIAALVFPLTRATASATNAHMVLVGTLDDATGAAQLPEALRLVLIEELQQSRELVVATPERIADALRLMRRPPTTSLDEATALEVSRRDGGIRTVITGRIRREGVQYTLQVQARRATTGASLVRASTGAEDIDALLGATRRLAGQVRVALGDSAQQVAADARLEPATTSSLDALRLYTEGVDLAKEHRWSAAELVLAEAVQLDPTFASALIALASARRESGRPADTYLPPAEEALRLAAALPSRERYFITGTYYLLTEDLSRAIAAFEVLTHEYPNDWRGLDNLAIAYVSSGRYREEIPIAMRLARLRPNDFAYLLEMAMAVIIDGGGLRAGREIADRATQLVPPAGHPADVYAAWLSLLPVFEAWAEGRVEAAAARLEALDVVPPRDDWEAFGRGQLYLSLGRVRAAERSFQSISSPVERTALLAYAALARGDQAQARTSLERVVSELPGVAIFSGQGGFGRATAVCWALARVGLQQGCRDLARVYPPVRVAPWFIAEAAARDGDDVTAVPILEAVQAFAPPGNPQTVMVSATLAAIDERRGDLARAAAVLARSEGARLAVYPNSGSRGFFWLVAQTDLLRIERERGNLDHAAAIERQLRRLLAVADPDFVLRSVLE